MPTITFTATLEVIECAACAVPFGIVKRQLEERRRDGERFYCPAGHVNVYRKTTEDQLRAELDQVKADRDWQRKQAEHGRARAEEEKRRAAAARGQVTKLRKRAAAGACPCCNRTFVDLARHVATKHPGFADAAAT